MPNDADAPAEYLTPYAAFPCVLIDRVMPTLKDTEWRLLCVVVRQTVGWGANGHRHKRRDWLTQRQLIARTGRNSAAISAALDAMVRRRLVDVTDEGGNLLLTPQERRRYSGRLFFSLCFEGLESLMSVKPIITKSEEPTGKSEVANANITIARRDNKLPDGKESSFKKEMPSSECRRFLRRYQDLFQERTVSGEAPPVVWGRDMKIARDLLRMYSFERLQALLQYFFSSNDPWFEKRGYSLPCFKDALPRLLLREGRTVSQKPTAYPVRPFTDGNTRRRANGFHDTSHQSRTYTGWQRAGDISQL